MLHARFRCQRAERWPTGRLSQRLVLVIIVFKFIISRQKIGNVVEPSSRRHGRTNDGRIEQKMKMT